MSARIIKAMNVNQALRDGLWHLKTAGITDSSRNGPVIRAPGPVITEYMFPRERLCFSPTRDANHVFHLMESIWMLAGQNNVEWLLQFNGNFGQYAEDGIQHGAYGHRWRRHFGADQLFGVIDQLHVPGNRRVVLQMWDVNSDLGANVADVPCNTHVYFQVTDEGLEMTVCCRSNDMVWGIRGQRCSLQHLAGADRPGAGGGCGEVLPVQQQLPSVHRVRPWGQADGRSQQRRS